MHSSDEVPSLGFLIERSSELKPALVNFACGPRFERHLARFMHETADRSGGLDDSDLISVIDCFLLKHRLPRPGFTVIGERLSELAGL